MCLLDDEKKGAVQGRPLSLAPHSRFHHGACATCVCARSRRPATAHPHARLQGWPPLTPAQCGGAPRPSRRVGQTMQLRSLVSPPALHRRVFLFLLAPLLARSPAHPPPAHLLTPTSRSLPHTSHRLRRCLKRLRPACHRETHPFTHHTRHRRRRVPPGACPPPRPPSSSASARLCSSW